MKKKRKAKTMIKVEYDKENSEMNYDITGDLDVVLNEYSALTKTMFETVSRMLGKDETKRELKRYYKIGIERAMKKEGADNE
jgi:hypothetical protein